MSDMPEPGLEPAFELVLQRAAPVVVGARSLVAITGGRLTGEGLDVAVVGGSETLLARGDGVTVAEVAYYGADGLGHAFRAFGQGYRVGGLLRVSLMFEAPGDGPFAHLTTRVFLGEQAGDAAMAVSRII